MIHAILCINSHDIEKCYNLPTYSFYSGCSYTSMLFESSVNMNIEIIYIIINPFN